MNSIILIILIHWNKKVYKNEQIISEINGSNNSEYFKEKNTNKLFIITVKL